MGNSNRNIDSFSSHELLIPPIKLFDSNIPVKNEKEKKTLIFHVQTFLLSVICFEFAFDLIAN